MSNELDKRDERDKRNDIRPPTLEELECLIMYPEGTKSYNAEYVLLQRLYGLNLTYGFGRCFQISEAIYDIWCYPDHLEKYRQDREEHLASIKAGLKIFNDDALSVITVEPRVDIRQTTENRRIREETKAYRDERRIQNENNQQQTSNNQDQAVDNIEQRIDNKEQALDNRDQALDNRDQFFDNKQTREANRHRQDRQDRQDPHQTDQKSSG